MGVPGGMNTIYGGAGNDWIAGDDNNDLLYGDDGGGTSSGIQGLTLSMAGRGMTSSTVSRAMTCLLGMAIMTRSTAELGTIAFTEITTSIPLGEEMICSRAEAG